MSHLLTGMHESGLKLNLKNPPIGCLAPLGGNSGDCKRLYLWHLRVSLGSDTTGSLISVILFSHIWLLKLTTRVLCLFCIISSSTPSGPLEAALAPFGR